MTTTDRLTEIRERTKGPLLAAPFGAQSRWESEAREVIMEQGRALAEAHARIGNLEAALAQSERYEGEARAEAAAYEAEIWGDC